MDENTTQNQRIEIARNILAYLVSHPQAGDTMEGVAHFWLARQQVMRQTALVASVLNELVQKDLLVREPLTADRTLYRINVSRHEEIRSMLGDV